MLERIARIGYRTVELVHELDRDRPWSETRAALDRHGLGACSMHAFFEELEPELDTVADAATLVGVDRIVCAWVEPGERRSLAGYERVADVLGRSAKRLAKRGLRLAYHHHDFELAPIDGRTGLDVILERVDPQLLEVEADVYWIHRAGLDPVEYIARLGERVTLLHCKDAGPTDMQPLVEPEEGLAVYNTEVGAGVLDFNRILEVAEHAQWLIVEQDFSAGDVFDSAELSLHALTALNDGRRASA